MVASALSLLGSDRTFELLEFLVLFFVLVSVITLAFLLAYQIRFRRAARSTDRRIKSVVRRLGRDVFGDEGWEVVERTVGVDGHGVDMLLELMDRDSFEAWASKAEETQAVEVSEIRLLRDRMAQPGEARRVSAVPVPVSECAPTFGMPVAVRQSAYQARGTIAEVEQSTFTMWVLGTVDEIDDSRPASFILLSRSGTYQFEARFSKRADGTLVVERPMRTLRSQRRRFERHPARLPVRVVPFLGSAGPTEALITELSGGGATVTNPTGSFSVGNVLTLSFAAGGRSYTVAGRVVRAEADAGSLHVRFEALKDQERHEIAESVALIPMA